MRNLQRRDWLETFRYTTIGCGYCLIWAFPLRKNKLISFRLWQWLTQSQEYLRSSTVYLESVENTRCESIKISTSLVEFKYYKKTCTTGVRSVSATFENNRLSLSNFFSTSNYLFYPSQERSFLKVLNFLAFCPVFKNIVGEKKVCRIWFQKFCSNQQELKIIKEQGSYLGNCSMNKFQKLSRKSRTRQFCRLICM